MSVHIRELHITVCQYNELLDCGHYLAEAGMLKKNNKH